jgi:hypothetical protein
MTDNYVLIRTSTVPNAIGVDKLDLTYKIVTSVCSPTKGPIGYCTIDMENGEVCDEIKCCVYCTKFWSGVM